MRLDRTLQAAGTAACAAALLAFAGPALASVEPSSSEVTLDPGQSTTIAKTATVPEIPAKLDVGLLIDLSESYLDDLPNIKAAGGPLFDQLAAAADVRVGVASFVDFPIPPWGVPSLGDYAYDRELDMTADKAAFETALNGLAVRGGFDLPESQYEALVQIATGAGRDVQPAGPSSADVAPGKALSLRPDATKVVVITTDAPFHEGGEPCGDPGPCPFPYPGATRGQAVAALNAAGIRVIALKAPGAGAEMDDLAAATGGAVVPTSGDSSDIGDAILQGLSQVLVDIAPDGSACAPLQVTFTPASHEDVPSGESRQFEEQVSVPPGTPAGTYECVVDFGAAGQQKLVVVVPRQPTQLRAEPAIATVVPGLKVPLGRLQARLTSAGQPVGGRHVVMTVGSQTICAATTNASGVASCNGTFSGLLAVVLNLGYRATFVADASYLGSSDEAPIVRAAGINLLRG